MKILISTNSDTYFDKGNCIVLYNVDEFTYNGVLSRYVYNLESKDVAFKDHESRSNFVGIAQIRICTRTKIRKRNWPLCSADYATAAF